MRYVILLILSVAIAGAVSPRRPSACSASGDTLRYREVTESELTLYTPAGTRLLDQKHDATITLAFGADSSVSAWYDSLALEVEWLRGVQRPATAALVGQPFHLLCDSRGRLTTIRAPAIPADVRELSDLAQQFTDFLVPIPPAALVAGAAWTDTLAQVVPENGGAYRKYTAVASWRVQKDTLVAGGRGWILTGRSKLSLDSGDPLARNGQAQSVLTGQEEGSALVAEDGRLLSRTRQADLKGQLTIRSGPGARNFAQGYSYRSRITHVP